MRPRAPTPLLLGAAVLLLALNLRVPLTAVPPVLDDIRTEHGLSIGATGALTALPLLCFGACGLLAAPLAWRWGSEAILLRCVSVMAAGILVRLAPQASALFAGTLLLGVAIAIANILVPATIKRGYARPGLMMGVYAMVLNVGAALGAGLTVPLEAVFGDAWRAALAFWVVPLLPAALLWWRIARSARHVRAALPRARPPAPPWRSSLAWQLTGLMGIQSTIFYSCLAWIPDILRETGMSSQTAGLMLAIVMLLGLPSSLAISILAGRTDDQRRLVAVAGAAWFSGLIGLMLAPDVAPALWMALMGVAQGTSVGLALTIVVLRAADEAVAAALSGMTQSVGYMLAAAGPVAIGVLHDLTGSWETPIAALLVCVLAFLASGVAAARPGGLVEETRVHSGAVLDPVTSEQ